MKLSEFGVIFTLVMLITLVHASVGTRTLEEVGLGVKADEKDAQPQEKVSQDENQIKSEDGTQSENVSSPSAESTEVSEKVEESEKNSVENSDSAENSQQNDSELKEGETNQEENVAESEEAVQSEESEKVSAEEETSTKESINSAKVPENNQQKEETADAAKEQKEENPQNKPNEQPNEAQKKQEVSTGYFQMSLSFVIILFGGVFAFFVGFYRYSLNKYRIAPFSPPSFCPNFLFPRPESSAILDDYYAQDLEMTNGFGNHKYHAII